MTISPVRNLMPFKNQGIMRKRKNNSIKSCIPFSNGVKVLHISSSNEWGGTQQRIFMLSKILNNRQIETFVALPPRGLFAEKLKDAGIEIIPFEFKSKWDVQSIFLLRKILFEKKIHILHVHRSNEHFIGFLATKCFSPYRIKLIRTKHDDIPISNNIFNHLLYSRFTDKIIAVGEEIKQKIIRENCFNPSHIVTIHSSALIDRFDPKIDGGKIRMNLSIPDNAPLIGTIGKIHPRKDYVTFLKACKLVKNDFLQAKFLWVGDGSDEEKAKSFAYELGLQDSVIFTGIRTDIPEILAALDVFVLSSKGEGSPAVIKEALLMEKPVVSTNVGSISEIIENGYTGILVPPENPNELAEEIIKILRNPETKEMGKKGRKIIKEKFNESVLAEKTKKVYMDLLR